MGSADTQGPLWGAGAKDWSELAEPAQIPFYEAAFDALGVGTTTNLLDVGCGAGLAMQLAAKRGASASGVDAAAGSSPSPTNGYPAPIYATATSSSYRSTTPPSTQ